MPQLLFRPGSWVGPPGSSAASVTLTAISVLGTSSPVSSGGTACPTAFSATGASRGVWLSRGGSSKSPQTVWLVKSKDSSSHSPATRSRKSRCPQVALPLKALGRVLPASFRFRWPWPWARPSGLHLQLLPSDKDTCHGFTDHRNDPGQARLKSLHLTTPAKTSSLIKSCAQGLLDVSFSGETTIPQGPTFPCQRSDPLRRDQVSPVGKGQKE